MIVECKYFQLKEEKKMQDGNFIPAKQKLLYICTEEDMMMFETVDDTDIKLIFWTTPQEVEFLFEQQEEWTEEQIKKREKEITGQWL